VTTLANNCDDSLASAGCVDGRAMLFNMTNNNVTNLTAKAAGAGDDVTSLKFSSCKRHILAASDEGGRLRLWDCNRDTVVASIVAHAAPCSSISFSPVNDMLILSSGLDKKFVCYDIASKRLATEFSMAAPLTAVEALPDGRSMALGTIDGQLLIYDLRSFSHPLMTVPPPPAARSAADKSIVSLAVRPEGREVTLGSSNSLNGTSALRSQRSKSKLLPRAYSSTSSLQKENVLPPATATPSHLSPLAPEGSKGTMNTSVVSLNRDSFSSQVFSPLREVGVPANTSPAAAAGNVSISSVVGTTAATGRTPTLQDGSRDSSLFSPLRETSGRNSISSPLVADGPGSRPNSFLRSPIENFNKSITSPLVSPLTMIHEEEMLATPEEDDDDGRVNGVGFSKVPQEDDDPMPKLSNDSFARSAAIPSEAGDAILGPPSSVRFEPAKNTVDSVSATASTTTFEKNAVSSTPANKAEMAEQVSVSQVEKPPKSAPSPVSLSGATNNVSQIRAVLTAFPKAFLDTRLAEEAAAETRAILVPDMSRDDQQEEEASAPAAFQREFILKCVEDAVEDQCEDFRMHLWRIQLDMAQAFERQRLDLEAALTARDEANIRLAEECHRLRAENERLRRCL